MLRMHSETKLALLDTLGIPYFMVEDEESLYLFVTQTGLQSFLAARQDKPVADTESLQAQADRLNLLPNWAKVREVIAAAPLTDQDWDFNYQLCTRCTEPKPHAYMYTREGEMVFDAPIYHLFASMVNTHEFLQHFPEEPEEALHLLKQAAELLEQNDYDKTE
jgi:hypothetical protein